MPCAAGRGAPLRAAHTLTVSRDNLDGILSVIDWCLHNRDVFGLVSLQPVAQVGRTRSALGGVRADELWERIGRVLTPYGFRVWSGSRAYPVRPPGVHPRRAARRDRAAG